MVARLVIVLVMTSCAAGSGCARPTVALTHNQKMVRANAILLKVGPFAEGSMYSCMLNGYLQGLSLKQAQDECATKLIEDDQKGFGGPLGEVHPDLQPFFDPTRITAACHSGDPRFGQTSGMGQVSGKQEYGYYTWGAETNRYYGLSEEQSRLQKEEAIAYAEAQTKLFLELEEKANQAEAAVDDAKASGDAAAVAKAEAEAKAAVDAAARQATEALQAAERAKEDPNEKPLTTTRPVQGESPCEQALNAARELLRECHRTGWKAFACQQLQAKMNRCPDPALIRVDPDQGYACGMTVDPEALKDAWVERCESRKQFGPDGPNPCVPPEIDAHARFAKGPMGDICNDPAVRIDPSSGDCAATFTIQPFGQVDIQKIAVLALNKFGGPIIVIPPKDPDPRPGPKPGPDPRPGPKP